MWGGLGKIMISFIPRDYKKFQPHFKAPTTREREGHQREKPGVGGWFFKGVILFSIFGPRLFGAPKFRGKNLWKKKILFFSVTKRPK